MHLIHAPNDPLLEESLRYLAQLAMESPQSNMRVQTGTVTISCTADTLATQAVTFNKPFLSAPTILQGANPSVTSSVLCLSHDKTKLTATGYQPQVYTSSTQSVDVSYIAIGQV